MCGIVGYIGHREAVPVLLEGLSHLEYRGYDSAGVACLPARIKEGLKHNSDSLFIVKEKGKLLRLKAELANYKFSSNIGIGHTRWATHGEPSRVNAHPHTDSFQQIAIVHNGIIENYASLKQELLKKGLRFQSATDTEVAANLIGSYYRKGHLLEAIQKAVKRLNGYFAFVAVAKDDPDQIIVFKRSNPIVIGIGQGENFVASDVPALLPYTRKVIYLNDEEYAVLRREGVKIYSAKNDREIKREPMTVRWDVSQAQKSGYPHFMLKEIYEQPAVLKTILDARLQNGRIDFEGLTASFRDKLKKVEKIHFVSCGTAYHAGLVGTYMVGETMDMPTQATVSSEFRYEDPCVTKKDLVIFITQSGETADTLAALREAKAKGALTLAVVNVVGSTIAREAESVIYTHAGPEIGVASTKAYVAQLMALALFSLYMAKNHLRRKKSFGVKEYSGIINSLQKLPSQVREVLKQEVQVKKCSRILFRKKNFLYIGRGYNFPNALEGALKLKEITYAHAHGYPAGEMKHGPIALIDSQQPVICICVSPSRTYEKMISNIEEIKARRGIVIGISSKGDRRLSQLARINFSVPSTVEMLSPILTAIPLQLLAYHIAVMNGRDVDQPRNLAKSVTVE